jgi:hypothetical protein
MNVRKLIVTFSLVLAAGAVIAAMIVLPGAAALGQPEPPREGQAEPGQRPPLPPEGPGGFPGRGRGPGGPAGFGLPGGGPVALAVQGDYLYVVRGNTLYQFRIPGMALAKKVTLEEERPFAPMDRPRGEPRGEPRRERPPQKDRE